MKLLIVLVALTAILLGLATASPHWFVFSFGYVIAVLVTTTLLSRGPSK